MYLYVWLRIDCESWREGERERECVCVCMCGLVCGVFVVRVE